MDYSVSILTTVADCDAVLALAQNEKEAAEHRKSSAQWTKKQYSKNSVKVKDALAEVNAKLTSYEILLQNLPDGPQKKETEILKAGAIERKLMLENRSADYSVVSVLEKELDLARVEDELVQIAAFIAAVEAHKATL